MRAGRAEGRTVERELQSGQPEGGSEEAGGRWRGGRGHRQCGWRHLPGGSPQVRDGVFLEWVDLGLSAGNFPDLCLPPGLASLSSLLLTSPAGVGTDENS